MSLTANHKRAWKKWRGLLAFMAICLVFLALASSAAAQNEKPWIDWPEESLTEAQFMKEQGFFLGKSDGTFGPWDSVSEYTVALIAQRVGADTPNLGAYSDYSAGKDWVIKYFFPNTGVWNPEAKVTRFQLLLMSYRWVQSVDRLKGERPVPKHALYTEMGAKIDALMSRYPGSKLQGQGVFIATLADAYNIPLDLALGMFGKESTFCSQGGSVGWNNPGNIKPDGYARYPTIEVGIEAYFRLLATGPGGSGKYRRFIDAGDYVGLYNTYAPPSDNPGYVSDAESIRRMVRRELGL